MNSYDLSPSAVASAIFGGFADSDFAQAFMGLVNGVALAADALASRVDEWLSSSVVGGAWDFFKRWFRDDPVGATAGALLGAVVLIVGGKIIGAMIGGIGALLGGGKLAALFGGLSLVGAIGITLRFAVQGVSYLWNFNWNVSDEDLAQQQQAIINSIYGQLGAVTGTLAGTLLCGAAPVEIAKRSKFVKVNPLVLAKLKEVSEGPLWNEPPELYEELIEQVKSLITIGARSVARLAFMESYKNIRKIIKNLVRVSGILSAWPGLERTLLAWGEEQGASWSFSEAIEERIESINDPRARNFTEEFYEQLMDSCGESVMIISYAF